MSTVLRAGLNISGDGARVVVGLHDDQARAENHQECESVGGPTVGDPDCGSGRCRVLHGRAIRSHHGRFPVVTGHTAVLRRDDSKNRVHRLGTKRALQVPEKRGERRVIGSEGGGVQGRRLRRLGIYLLFAQGTITVVRRHGPPFSWNWVGPIKVSQKQSIPAGVSS